MSKASKIFDLEERLIDFAVRIIRTNELISIFVTSVKTAKQKGSKTS